MSSIYTIARYMNMRNLHGMFIYIYIYIYIYMEHRNLEIRKTRNDFSVQVHIFFLLPLCLKVFRHKERERETHNLSILAFSSPPPTRATPAQDLHEQAKVNCLVQCLVSTRLTFFKFPKPSVCFRCVTSFELGSLVSHLGLLWHLWVTRLLRTRAREHLC